MGMYVLENILSELGTRTLSEEDFISDLRRMKEERCIPQILMTGHTCSHFIRMHLGKKLLMPARME